MYPVRTGSRNCASSMRLSLMLLAVATPAVSCSAAPQPPPSLPTVSTRISRTPPPTSFIVEIDPVTQTATFVPLIAGDRQVVELSDLAAVDADCLQSYYWQATTPEEVRVRFLRRGCVALKEGAGSQSELSAQTAAQNEGVGVWQREAAPESSPTPASESSTNGSLQAAARRAIEFWQEYWQFIVGAVLAVVGG